MLKIDLTVSATDFDKHGYLFCVKNGVLDLAKGEFREHRREDLLTRCADVIYDPQATCPLWLQFLNGIFLSNQDTIRGVQKIFGRCLTGDVIEQHFYLLFGPGQNGKTVLSEALRKIFGPYAKTLEAASLLVKNSDNIRNDIAKLKGARFVSASEPPAGRKLDEGLIKLLTGGDVVTARYLHKEFFDFTPTFKLFLITNYLPEIIGLDKGIWRRIVVIPFPVSIPDDQKDAQLLNKLTQPESLSGILNWLIEGYRLWREEGLEPWPLAMQVAIDAYRDSADHVRRFIKERCYVNHAVQVKFKALYAAYQSWCHDNEEAALSKKAFSQRLLSYTFTDCYVQNDRGYHGLMLIPQPSGW
jgi:putative DNA primase/helicase